MGVFILDDHAFISPLKSGQSTLDHI